MMKDNAGVKGGSGSHLIDIRKSCMRHAPQARQIAVGIACISKNKGIGVVKEYFSFRW